jgi:hypothetical protein
VNLFARCYKVEHRRLIRATGQLAPEAGFRASMHRRAWKVPTASFMQNDLLKADEAHVYDGQ